jgi:hypothetical protein
MSHDNDRPDVSPQHSLVSQPDESLAHVEDKSIPHLKGKRAMIVTLIGTAGAWLSQFFKWGIIVIDSLQRADFLNTKFIDLLRWLFSPSGAYFFGGLCLMAFLIATYRTVHTGRRSEQSADALPGSNQKQLEEKRIPTVPYERRKAADEVPHPRESTESINVPTQEQSVPTQEQPTPNLKYSVIDSLPAHEEYGFLVEDHVGGDSDVFVYGVRISNEFDPSRKVGVLNDVSAQIFYTPRDGQPLKVLRGTWLSESSYQVNFDVNREHRLIIAGIPRRVTQGAQLVFYFRREVTYSDTGIKNRIAALGGDSYQVKIRLITESKGVVHGERDYKLTITREPIFKIELVEDEQQTAPVSDREGVLQALRGLQVEGNRLLSQSISNPLPDASAVYAWEDRAERYIKDNIGAAQAMEFIRNAPIHPYPGPTINRELTNRINTRLHHLGRLISVM